MTKPAERIFVALDTTNVEEARALAQRLKGAVGGVKLGLEFFYGEWRAAGSAPSQKPACRCFST